MTSLERQDVEGVACPDCGAAVYREFHDVVNDGRPAPMPHRGMYGCHGAGCAWQSPDKPVSPGHFTIG